MKKTFLLFCYLLLVTIAKAQLDKTPLYFQFPDVPPFSITKTPDNTLFTKNDLKKRKATLIMLFSPDCDHCQQQVKALKENIDLLKQVQIVMVSFLNDDLIKKFYLENEMAAYSTITMGRDGKYFLGTFYKFTTFPSMYLYNKKGKFIEKFEGITPINKIAASL